LQTWANARSPALRHPRRHRRRFDNAGIAMSVKAVRELPADCRMALPLARSRLCHDPGYLAWCMSLPIL